MVNSKILEKKSFPARTRAARSVPYSSSRFPSQRGLLEESAPGNERIFGILSQYLPCGNAIVPHEVAYDCNKFGDSRSGKQECYGSSKSIGILRRTKRLSTFIQTMAMVGHDFRVIRIRIRIISERYFETFVLDIRWER